MLGISSTLGTVGIFGIPLLRHSSTIRHVWYSPIVGIPPQHVWHSSYSRHSTTIRHVCPHRGIPPPLACLVPSCRHSTTIRHVWHSPIV
ncbi:hypothetical protein AVEN_116208-1 [Araneus ventricosus]|uniref:Uncharacterized protein n=1 Tax=Araneus ventricosus TaxID=182803 RepID=A0A4Y2SWT7_ARAVE|nr:hypothetical protein AVEN_116208-1 [Araneus ventricosus]